MNFGHTFMAWIEKMYAKQEAYICLEGCISRKFELERRVCQGCPLCPLISHSDRGTTSNSKAAWRQ